MNRVAKKLIIPAGILLAILAVIAVYFGTHKVSKHSAQPDYGSLGSGYDLDDSQSYWKANFLHDFTAAEDGYYFITPDMTYLMYFDYATKEVVPVCGKPDCAHDNSTCNANMMKQSYVVSNIYYHEGYLYYMQIQNGMSVLTRMDKSGNNVENIGEIFPSDQDSSTHLVFHGDYVYAYYLGAHYGMEGEFTEAIKKMSLKDGSSENIYEVIGNNISIGLVKSYGDKLYFAVQEQLEKRSMRSKTKALYSYDYNTKEIKLVAEDDISDYCFIPEKNIFAYYVVGEGLYYADAKEQVMKLVMKSDSLYDRCSMSYDGKYIYMDNITFQNMTRTVEKREYRIIIIDSDGNKINEIECDDTINNIYYGDERCMFAWGSVPKKDERAEYFSGYLYIDKKDIEHAGQWESVYDDTIFLFNPFKK